MATAARLSAAATTTVTGGATGCSTVVVTTTASSSGVMVTSDGGAGCNSANTSPLHQPTQLIVLPATLHQGTATVVNGVPVIDVSAIEQAADSSNGSSTGADHLADQENHLATPSPHFITVTA